MRRVFGVKKEKAPAPTVEEATQRVSAFSCWSQGGVGVDCGSSVGGEKWR